MSHVVSHRPPSMAHTLTTTAIAGTVGALAGSIGAVSGPFRGWLGAVVYGGSAATLAFVGERAMASKTHNDVSGFGATLVTGPLAGAALVGVSARTFSPPLLGRGLVSGFLGGIVGGAVLVARN